MRVQAHQAQLEMTSLLRATPFLVCELQQVGLFRVFSHAGVTKAHNEICAVCCMPFWSQRLAACAVVSAHQPTYDKLALYCHCLDVCYITAHARRL